MAMPIHVPDGGLYHTGWWPEEVRFAPPSDETPACLQDRAEKSTGPEPIPGPSLLGRGKGPAPNITGTAQSGPLAA